MGTNGGTLEAIDAETGVEAFAYVPEGVYDNLALLTDPSYAHHYYVDGAPTVSDAYLGGAWKTVLVGGLGGGGKTIYALNITDPASFSASNVMWEFTDSDMGYSYSKPQIAILESGQWVAIFGNGYNSTGGGSYLYVVDLATGALIDKITAMDGPGDDNNGLSSPVLYDADGNGKIDTVYAGDLQGYLWKFDLSTATATEIYRACRDDNGNGTYCETGEQQPITSQPQVTNCALAGTMVVFGTGRYLTSSDVADANVQTFYGVRDDGSTITDQTELQQQTVDVQTNAYGNDVRSVTNNSVDWATQKGWYVNLPDSPGERVVSAPLIKHERAIFVTTVPSTDACTPGGDSWLMELDVCSGGAPPSSVFDLNGDETFDSSDEVSGHVVAGLKSTVGLSKTPVWLDKTGAIAFKVLTGTSGGFMSVTNNPCPPAGCGPGGGGGATRVYWMQIR